jgi:geranylgeranyl diphosphate synthase type I
MIRPDTASIGLQPVGETARRDGSTMPKDFELFVGRVRAQVEESLAGWLEGRIALAERRGPDIAAVADSIRQLALRGGKRMRAVLLAAAYEGCGGEGGAKSVTFAGVALELLQAYLLAHDDWMDRDDVRRGGPSVPAMIRARFAADKVDSMSVLAGDLAAAWARRALFEVPLAPERVGRAAREMACVEEDVVEGQVLDVGGCATDAAAVEAVHVLKTSSYTVRGPVVMGAHLAGASDACVAALRAFSDPLGIAFQLRDDLLGVFGDPRVTGKPAGNDLVVGKRSAVVIEAIGAGWESDLAPVFGRTDASDADVRAAVERLAARGIVARVEARIDALVREACVALDRAALTATGRALFSDAVVALTHRRS